MAHFLGLARPHSALWWLLAVGIGLGGIRIGLALSPMLREDLALGALVALIVGLFAALYLRVVLCVDIFHSRFAALLFAAFILGASIPTWLSLIGNNAGASFLPFVVGQETAMDWGAALTGPATEEWSKAVAVAALMLLYPRLVARPVQGFIVGATAGLGFQFTEDVLYALASGLDNPNSNAAGAFETLFVRAVLGLSSHCVYTAIAGVALAVLFGRTGAWSWSPARRVLIATGLFALSFGLHFLWNSPIGLGWGLGGILLKAVLTIVVALLVAVWINRNEAAVLRRFSVAIASPEVAVAFSSWRARRRVLSTVRKDYDRAAAARVRKSWRQHYRLLQEELRSGEVAGDAVTSGAETEGVPAQVLKVEGQADARPEEKRKHDDAKDVHGQQHQ